MPKNHDNQNMATKIWIHFRGQEEHVCMEDLHHGKSGSSISSFLLAMVWVTEVWVVIQERGISKFTICFQASLCSQFVVIIY